MVVSFLSLSLAKAAFYPPGAGNTKEKPKVPEPPVFKANFFSPTQLFAHLFEKPKDHL